MSDLLSASIKEQLWHKMRYDLARYVPEIANNQLLMCCCCGRLLPQEFFDLEHLIPQQALKDDPPSVRRDPTTPANVRARNLLLCRKPIMFKKSKLYNNGCNSWKGKFYDKSISDIVGGRIDGGRPVNTVHLIGGLILAYLAMVAEFGYVIALMESGLLLREQFFNPGKFHPNLPLRHQMFLAGMPFTEADSAVWSNPFSFKFERGACFVTIRNYVVIAPVSRDPSAPIAQHLRIVPHRFAFRPNFNTVFT